MSKIAVVLFNLGSPDSKSAIVPFLFNFFMDKNIIRLPYPLRWFIAKRISQKRSRGAADSAYAHLDYCSPLLENTQKQARALEDLLNSRDEKAHECDEYKSFVSMRYWHPRALEALKNVQDWGADEIILLPLYPQYSTTTTKSSFEEWDRVSEDLNYECSTSKILDYPEHEGFIAACKARILEALKQARDEGHKTPRLLFSAHGLPEAIIRAGDPYQSQCEQTVAAIVAALGIENLDWALCYQSRVGPKKWIAPSIDDELKRAVSDQKAVVIFPSAFTQEHVETLVELDIEYRTRAKILGIPAYYRAQTVGTHPDFIAGLAELIITLQDN